MHDSTADPLQTVAVEERREKEALAIIAVASSTVLESLEFDKTLSKIAEMAIPKFGDMTFVYVVDGEGNLTRQNAAAADPEKQRCIAEMWNRFPPRTEVLRRLVKTGKSELHAQVEEKEWGFVADTEHRGMLSSLGIRSAVNVAIRVSGKSVGVMSFARTDGNRPYDDFDVLLAEELARLAAIAIEKSRLFEAERHAREEAERASRAKDEFLAVLSHELRTPMTTVIGWADFLKMTHGNDPALANAIDSLRTSARVQAKLVDDLLDVSRIVTGKLAIRMVDTELVGIIKAAVDSIRITAAEKKLEISTEMPDQPVRIHGDPDRLQQIVLNLLSNAMKFTSPGGKIFVTVQKSGDRAEVIVADMGEGISPDFLPHVFDRFRQASIGDSRRHTGLGLGLSIVQHLVRLHGGSVRAESDGLGKGARFTITLPTIG